ncbi:MAG: holo-[acyl-carrier-protein] synthase [Chloroflexi bacterium]|nr:MAG: holo-[acyl-carrier-protein] synthase [Chloroflexota bacterium]
MKAVGVDIIETERIAGSVARFGDRFLRRVYTAQELAYCDGRTGSLAARWAAKEAVSKVLGTGIGDVNWHDIEVVNDERCRPAIQLHGAAAQLAARLGISAVAVSLSHTREHAIAFVVAE